MPPNDQNIVVQIAANSEKIGAGAANIEQLVKAVCSRFDLENATISIAIVDDAHFREINAKFRNSKTTSDCLSFDLSDDGEPASPKLFELVVNGELAAKEAEQRNHSSEAELALYITHGLLHNLGFDDSTEELAKQMHEAEDRILQQLGYGFVYNTRIKSKQRKPTTNA